MTRFRLFNPGLALSAASCLVLAAFCAAPVQALTLDLPVRCDIGKTCLIQKLFDHDPGAGVRDYRCGTLATDGHDGVDIRLRTMADMMRGFAVVAAAPGRVLRVRDGEPDISVGAAGSTGGRDAGNGVVIDHGDGWETQYSHLRQGSIAVRPGQSLPAGAPLGQIGLSGNSEFPHLHFTVRYRGQAVDPFVGAQPRAGCAASAADALWSKQAATMLEYRPTAIITAALVSQVPPRAAGQRTSALTLAGPGEPILLWVDVIGARPGDAENFHIVAPGGGEVFQRQSVIEKGGLSWTAYSGKRAPPGGWARGVYSGRYMLTRQGKVIGSIEVKGALR